MANSLVRNPILIDTWSTDVTISSTPICVRKILLLSATAGELLYLEDVAGNQVALLVTKANAQTTELDFGESGFIFDGLQIDVSDCTGIAAGDLAWIYTK